MARLLPQPKKHVHCPPWTSPVIIWGHRSAVTRCNGSPSSEDLGLRLGTNRGQVGEVQPGLASTGHNLLPPHRVIPEYYQRSPVLGPHGTGGSPGEDIFHLSVSLTWGAPNRSPNLTTSVHSPLKTIVTLQMHTPSCEEATRGLLWPPGPLEETQSPRPAHPTLQDLLAPAHVSCGPQATPTEARSQPS